MSNKARFSRADWVALGLARLSDAGTEAIKLEAICAAAGLTRGSFYYHFSDHGDFLIALTQGWADKQTRDVAEQAEGAKGPDVAAQLLTDAALQIDYRLELGIRELARRVPEVAALVKTTDAARLAILAELFQARFGLAADAAQRFAFLEYAAFCGAILLEPHMSAQKQAELAALWIKAWPAQRNRPNGNAPAIMDLIRLAPWPIRPRWPEGRIRINQEKPWLSR